MTSAVRFDANWGSDLKGSSVALTILIGGLGIVPSAISDGPGRWLGAVIVGGLLMGAALFSIRGYSVTEDSLAIHHPLHSRSYALSAFKRVELQRDIIAESHRAAAIGGLFSFQGAYRHDELGPFDAYVTDGERTVVLSGDEATLVISPSDPERFVRVVAPLLGEHA